MVTHNSNQLEKTQLLTSVIEPLFNKEFKAKNNNSLF